MPLIETRELTGAALDWAVAKCEAQVVLICGAGPSQYLAFIPKGKRSHYRYEPSRNWKQGGLIIEREKITLVCAEGDYNPEKAGTPDCYDTYWAACEGKLRPDAIYGPQGDEWGRCFQVDDSSITGPTLLIAAMRSYVSSKLGETINVPEGLV